MAKGKAKSIGKKIWKVVATTAIATLVALAVVAAAFRFRIPLITPAEADEVPQ